MPSVIAKAQAPVALPTPTRQRTERGAAADVDRYAVERAVRHGVDAIVHMTALQAEPTVQTLIRDRQDISEAPEELGLHRPVGTGTHLAR